MTNSQEQHMPRQSVTTSLWTGEKIAWWVVFGVLVLSIFTMLGAWN